MDILSVLDFLNKPEVKDGLEETARLYFTSDTVTINLVWSAIILGLLGLGKLSPTSDTCISTCCPSRGCCVYL